MTRNSDNRSLLLFRVGPVLCCVPSYPITSIIPPPTLTRPPGSDTAKPGIFKYAQHIVTTFDLRYMFGIDKALYLTPGRIIITQLEAGNIGFWVDELHEVIETPATGWGQLPPYLPKGVFSKTLILDDSIFLYAEFENLFKIPNNEYLLNYIEYLEQQSLSTSTRQSATAAGLTGIAGSKKTVRHSTRTKKDSTGGDKDNDKQNNTSHPYVNPTPSLENNCTIDEANRPALSSKSKKPNTHCLDRDIPTINHELNPEKSKSEAQSKDYPNTQESISDVISEKEKSTHPVDKNKTPKTSQTIDIHTSTNNGIGLKKQELAITQTKLFDSTENKTHALAHKSNKVDTPKTPLGKPSKSTRPASRSLTNKQKSTTSSTSPEQSSFNAISIPRPFTSSLNKKRYAPEQTLKSKIPEHGNRHHYGLLFLFLVTITAIPGSIWYFTQANPNIKLTQVKPSTKQQPDAIRPSAYPEININPPNTPLENKLSPHKAIVVPYKKTSTENTIAQNTLAPNTTPANQKQASNSPAIKTKVQMDKTVNANTQLRAEIKTDQSGITIIIDAPEDTSVFKQEEDKTVSDKTPAQMKLVSRNIEPNVANTQSKLEPAILSTTTSGEDTKDSSFILTTKPNDTINKTADTASPFARTEITHVVVKGDTLWHIAIRYVKNPYLYPELARLSNIKDPDLIYPGNRVRIIKRSRKTNASQSH